MARKGQAGLDDQFVKELVAHQPLIRTFIVSLLPGVSECEDVAQNTNEVLWKKRNDFLVGSNFKAWALKIARFQCMAYLQKNKREKITFMDAELSISLMDSMSLKDPEETNEKLVHLKGCMNKLKKQDQELILHRYKRETKLGDLAQERETTVEGLRALLYRLRGQLKKCVLSKISEGGAA